MMPGTALLPASMDALEARALTERIKSTSKQLWTLLLEAHERQAWLPLGYRTWREYAKTEFSMSQAQAYRLLNQGHVTRVLAEAAHSPNGEIAVTEIEAREIKPVLALVADAVRDDVDQGEDPQVAVERAIGHARKRYMESRKWSDRLNRNVEGVVSMASLAVHTDDLRLDLDQIDEALIPVWVQELKEAEARIVAFRKRLEQRQRAG